MGGWLAALSGSLIAGGVVLFVYGLQRTPLRPAGPSRGWRLPGWVRDTPPARLWGGLVALLVGVLVAASTGWVVAVLVLPAAVWGLPLLLVRSEAGLRIGRLDGIAEWTRNLAGVLTVGQGLEQALQASVRSTPEAILPEVTRLVTRLRARWSTDAALRAFADDLNDVTGDLVVAALILGARRRGDGLARVLTGLSESVAADVLARRQIEAEREKPRATARLITLISAGALGVLALTGQFLAPFASPFGQIVLTGLLALYAAGLVWLKSMSATPTPPRFITTRVQAAR
ncbi:MAG: type II secretion system F family protein [Micropruina sp.]|nr:type II secretion system F family protein [Micropruina sp.]